MADPQYPPSAGHEPAFQAWRQLVEKGLQARDFSALQSRTRDGIVIEPLYPPHSDTSPLPGRGARPWTIVSLIDDADPERANAQVLADLGGGATGICLRFAGSPLAAGSGLPAAAEPLAVALDCVDLAHVRLRIDPHPLGPEIAGWVRDLIARRSIATELTDIAFGLDPVAAELQGSATPQTADRLVEVFAELQQSGFKAPVAELDARPFHEAGATEAQELAALIASAAWWLRALEKTGFAPDAVLSAMGASLSVDRDQFLSIAKIRALRLLWARIEDLCQTAPGHVRIHAETSRRMMAGAAPHTNLVRATIASFAAAVGGADSIAVLPYSAPLGAPDAAARALARNTQHLLIEESQLHRVADAAAGSGALEALTDALAEHAWAEFQRIEGDGGIVASLRSGAFPARIAAAREILRREVADGAVPLVGATMFRDPGEAAGAVSSEAGGSSRLAPVRLESMAVS